MTTGSKLETTTVGSYPTIIDKEKILLDYHKKNDPYLDCIERSVNDQIEAGIEVISDGQTRKDMIDLFGDGLLGFRIKKRTEIISEVKWKRPITVKDQKYIKESFGEDVRLKGIITGPWTLYKNSIDKYYKSDKEAVMDISSALSKEAELLSNVCDYVQIDEPFFSVEYPDFAYYAIKIITDRIKSLSILHVCGDVNDTLEKLVELEVDVLDHEFAEHPSLYDTFNDLDFSQRIAVGVVNTKTEIDEIHEIKNRIEKAYEFFGPDCMVDPDCGLRHLERDTAIEKLRNMVKARDGLVDEL